MMFELLLDVT